MRVVVVPLFVCAWFWFVGCSVCGVLGLFVWLVGVFGFVGVVGWLVLPCPAYG